MTEEGLGFEYREYISKKWLFLILSVVLVILSIIISITLGSADISLKEVVLALFGEGESYKVQIIWNIRIPRVLAAIIAGLALSTAGVSMQSILRNPLGSPFTLGISQAAAFGAAFSVVVLGVGTINRNLPSFMQDMPYLITISAFVFSLVSTGAILFISKMKRASPETMVLGGIAFGFLFQSATMALQYFATQRELAQMVFWTFGDIGEGSWVDVGLLFLVEIPILLYFIKNSWDYNALDSGDETAKSLGVDVEKMRIRGMLLASLATAFVISIFGIIGFVGLVVPHIVRKVIGGDERFLIPGSAIFGGAFLLISDTVARTILSPIILPVGILTSFLGAPLFVYLIIYGREYW